MDQKIKNLKMLYAKTSKHSNYQILPEILKPVLNEKDILVKSRYEKERLDYILRQLNPSGKSFLDIGGNSGYFSFEMIDKGAKHVDYFEGNAAHAEFVKSAADILGINEQLHVFNEYYDFQKKSDHHYDVVLLLNVLHHVGDDYDDKNLSLNKAKQKIIESLNSMADKTTTMVFQLGFCWKGNRDLLLFENGTKKEMIDFIKAGTEKHWLIKEINVPEKKGEKIIYSSLNDENVKRNEGLGEFLNRPLFIMKSIS